MSDSDISSNKIQAVASIATDTIAVPTYGKGGVFTVQSHIHIAASPTTIANVILDPDSYPHWCSFVPKINVRSHPSDSPAVPAALSKESNMRVGTKITLHAMMNGGGLDPNAKLWTAVPTPNEVTVIKDQFDGTGREHLQLAWKSAGMPTWMMWSERVHDLCATEDGGTDYACWETFGGPVSHATKLAVGSALVNRFSDWATDLKRFVETSRP